VADHQGREHQSSVTLAPRTDTLLRCIIFSGRESGVVESRMGAVAWGLWPTRSIQRLGDPALIVVLQEVVHVLAAGVDVDLDAVPGGIIGMQ
jgi:hypothetical protein